MEKMYCLTQERNAGVIFLQFGTAANEEVQFCDDIDSTTKMILEFSNIGIRYGITVLRRILGKNTYDIKMKFFLI